MGASAYRPLFTMQGQLTKTMRVGLICSPPSTKNWMYTQKRTWEPSCCGLGFGSDQIKEDITHTQVYDTVRAKCCESNMARLIKIIGR